MQEYVGLEGRINLPRIGMSEPFAWLKALGQGRVDAGPHFNLCLELKLLTLLKSWADRGYGFRLMENQSYLLPLIGPVN